MVEPFEFKQCVSILKSTGKKARSLKQLKDLIALASDDCIFHHMHQYFLKEHILEYTNDFAHWAGESIEERALAEQLSNIDPYSFPTINGVRLALITVIEVYLRQFPEPRSAMPGSEFFFNETVTLVFPVGVRVRNLAEFLTAIKFVDNGAIYFHFFEARVRMTGGLDDFSAWMEQELRKEGLARSIRAIDPFMHSIREIREHIAGAVEEEVWRDMEGVT